MDAPPIRARVHRVSAAAQSVWAKSTYPEDGWLPLWAHMADSAEVAALLWDRWLPPRTKALVAEGLPGGEDDARRLATWLAAVHDIDKATPAFACQVEHLAARMRDHGLDMPTKRVCSQDRHYGPHGLAGS